MANTQPGWRLAVCLSHPIQYKVPLLRRLANHPQVARLKAFFYSDIGLVARSDAYHGVAVKWDVPLLEGYDSEILTGLSLFRHTNSGYFNPALLNRLLREPWDAVIISSYLYPSDWLAWTIGRIRRFTVLFYGEMYPRTPSKPLKQMSVGLLKKLMLRQGSACLAIGSVAAQVYRDLGVSNERIFLAPYAVDNDFFFNEASRWCPHQASLKAEYGIPVDMPVVLCVAGMVPKKRQIDLIEATARLHLPVRLVLVGHGPLMEDVRAFCEQRLPNTVLTGFKNQTELPKYYAMADVFVLPSLWEEFGLVINEAMCFGLPILVSQGVAAAQDLVHHGENGYVFLPGDVDGLASYLERLLSDADLRHQFGQRSREIIAGWSYTETIDGILSAIEFTRTNRS